MADLPGKSQVTARQTAAEEELRQLRVAYAQFVADWKKMGARGEELIKALKNQVEGQVDKNKIAAILEKIQQ